METLVPLGRLEVYEECRCRTQPYLEIPIILQLDINASPSSIFQLVLILKDIYQISFKEKQLIRTRALHNRLQDMRAEEFIELSALGGKKKRNKC